MDANSIEQMTAEANAFLDNNQTDKAKELFTRICAEDASNAEAWLMLGAINGEAGITDEATSCVRKAIDIDPGYAEAHFTLAQILHSQGDLYGALAAARSATESDPTYSEAFAFLAALHGQIGDLRDAEAAGRKAVAFSHNNADAHVNLGNVLRIQGKLPDAEDSFRQALQLSPNLASAYSGLGGVLVAQQQFEEAVSSLQRAIELQPDLVEAHLALGYACRAMGDREAARASYQSAIRLKPDYPAAHYFLGILEEESGNFDRALSCYDEVIRMDPGNIDAQAAQASVHERTGNAETAYGIIRPLLDSGARNARLGIAYSSVCRHHDNCNDAIRYLEGLAESDGLSSDEHADIHFSLGRLLDRAGQYDSAFSHFSQANDLIAFDYEPDQYAQYIDGIIAANSAEVLALLPVPAISSNRPVFIVGMLRSGTTLVEQIISAHPQAFGGGELGSIFRIADKLQAVTGSDKSYPSCIADIDQAAANAMTKEYLASLNQINPDSARVTDKMPHNFQHLGLIHALFPDASVIHVTRNPLDTCLSIYFHRFSGFHPYSFNLDNIASHYRQCERLMKYWKDGAKLPILDVRYEDLVGDPESVSKQIISHCGLDWDDSCLNFHETGRIAMTASYEQVRQPIYSSAIGRWKHYRQHIGPLLDHFPESQES